MITYQTTYWGTTPSSPHSDPTFTPTSNQLPQPGDVVARDLMSGQIALLSPRGYTVTKDWLVFR